MEMNEIHAKVFDILEKEHQNDPNFRFSLRRTNRFNRLAKGYWFHGNDGYLAVSFWSGMDWKNKTPNIFLVIWADGKSKLEISVTDSAQKDEFASKELFPALNERYDFKLNTLSAKDQHLYEGNDFEFSLKRFLKEEKIFIDRIVQNSQVMNNVFHEMDRISLIDEVSFEKNLKNVYKYKEKIKPPSRKTQIREIHVNHFGDIRKKISMMIPHDTQWIFLTGENGSGKTTVLRALTVGLMSGPLRELELYDDPGKYEIDIKIHSNQSNKIELYSTYASAPKMRATAASVGFAAYGASRLMTTSNSKPEASGSDYSIFNPDGLLLNLDGYVGELVDSAKNDRLDLIVDLLTDKELIPQLANIIFQDGGKYFPETLYVENDGIGGQYPPVTFAKLASGVKSMIAFLGDMLIRLFLQQSGVTDPSELCGVVLIDEIDIHLHPAMQKRIVEILTANFPNIQFIVSTHSAITLLGAPDNSVFFRVTRSKKNGICVDEINFDSEKISRLTPNIILTSPVFGLSEIFSRYLVGSDDLRTEDTWAEMEIFNRDIKLLISKYKDRKGDDII